LANITRTERATIVAVPKTIREKFGEDGSEEFVKFLNVSMDLKG